MARLRATAPAARSVLDSREHDGMLGRVGGQSAAHKSSLKKREWRLIKKQDHAHKGAPGYIQIANTWLIVNVGGGPTPDKPSVTLSVPANPDSVNSFMNIRVADIQACYELWRSRGAEFITEPKDKYGETRCYIRDPDGYIIEVGQSKPDFAYG
jgi:hypothetical protein